MKRICQLTVLILMIGTWAAAQNTPYQIHMTWRGDPQSSIVISWRTAGATSSVVEYGLTQEYTAVEQGNSGVIHHVELEDLEPGTEYHFRCGSGEEWSGDLTFETAPDFHEPFTFVALGDSRTHWTIWGDCTEAVLEADPAFFLHTGDLVESGGDQSEWNIWFKEGKNLLMRKVMMPAIGNHEDNSPKYYEQFVLPGNEDWFSFDYGNAHFVSLTTEKAMKGAQRDWLIRDLASTNATWKFVFFHQPMYSSGSHGPNRAAYEAWGDVLDQYHVDMVFNGHDHCYERTLPMYQDWIADAPEEGTIHIVTGGAGAPLRGLKSKGPWLDFFLSTNHFVELDVNGTELHMRAKFFNQTVFDEMHISKASLPDLFPGEISADPRYPQPHESSTVAVTVQNGGRAPSPPVNLKLELDGELLATLQVPSLEPRESAVVEAPWQPAAAGLWDVTATVDPDGAADEGMNEDNNVLSALVKVAEPAPDLVVESLRCDEFAPDPSQNVTFLVSVRNEGSAPSGEGSLLLEINGTPLAQIEVGDLAPTEGSTVDVPWAWTPGDYTVEAIIDAANAVAELDEGNNRLDTRFRFRWLHQSGPTYLPQGFLPGESVIMYYDSTVGEIPSGSETCVAVWGVNGWGTPSLSLAPPNTWTGKAFETAMQLVSPGLWVVELPTDQTVDWIDIEFRDRQVLWTSRDDNDGENWIVPGMAWAQERLVGLLEAIEEAELVGVDTAPYWEIVQEANASLGERRYLEAAELLLNATDRCKYEECTVLLTAATSEYAAAQAEGLEIPRVDIFLTAAEDQLGRGNYYGSRTYSLKCLDMISDARAAVPEVLGAASLFLAIILRRLRS